MTLGRPARPQGVKAFTGREPDHLPKFVAPIWTEATYIAGTAIRGVVPKWAELSSGLVVPAGAVTRVAPIDQLVTFLSFEELFGVRLPHLYAYDILKRIPILEVLVPCARLLAAYKHPSLSRADVDASLVNQWFDEPFRTKVENLLRDPGRALVAPQAIMATIQRALLFSPDFVQPPVKLGELRTAIFIIGDYLGSGRDREEESFVISNTPGELGREIISNQIFNVAAEEQNIIARFARIWLQMPEESAGGVAPVRLQDAYFDATGVSLTDAMSVAIALWATAINADPYISLNYLSGIPWDRQRLERAMSLFTAEIALVREEIRSEVLRSNADWSFDTLNRYPVLRTADGALIVLDPSVLVKRMFSSVLLYETRYGLEKSDDKTAGRRRAAQVDGYVRRMSEVYTAEVLDSVAPGGEETRRVYHDEHLRAAYSSVGVRFADAAIDYGDAWVVVEVTTSQFRRESVKGETDQAVMGDLAKLVEEAEQIDATIKSIRADEQTLTGVAPTGPRRRFYPLLIVTEGFPVNPITMTLLRNAVAERGLLRGDDVMPLEIADIHDLELVEGLQEDGGPSLREILDRKKDAGLALCAIRDYVLSELGLSPRKSKRIQVLFDEIFRFLLRTLYPEGGAQLASH